MPLLRQVLLTSSVGVAADEEDEEDLQGDGCDLTAKQFQSSNLLHFDFNQKLRWKLSSRSFVEDVLLAQVRSDGFVEDEMSRSLVIDVSNVRTMDWYTEVECNEICESVVPIPELDSQLLDWLFLFDDVSMINQLHVVLENSRHRPTGIAYNNEMHSDYEWTRMTIWNL